MEGAPCAFLLFLLMVFQPWLFGASAVRCDASPFTVSCLPVTMNGILGEFVIFPRLNPGAFKSIIWHSPSPANAKAYVSQLYFITLAVITPGAPGALPHVSMEDERYRGRARLHNQSYSLEISNLMLADVGMYSWETASADSNIFCSYDLHIHSEQRLSELEIRIQSVMAGNGTCNVIFTCSAGEENETIKYIWTRPVGAPVFSIEESLLVQHRLGDKDSPVTCTAMNPVSNSSASASPKAACEGPSLPQATSLPYCHAKGILVLGVLGTLMAGSSQ